MNSASSRLERSAFYVLLATVVIAPLAFWPSGYVPLDLAKTIVIALGTLVSAILLAILALKEHRSVSVPRPIFWTGALLCLSIVISAFLSGHFGKSFFGQGFEVGTASFTLMLFLGALVTFKLVRRQPGHVIILYTGLGASFLILYIFQLLRLVFGVNFASFGVLSTLTSTVFGSWYDLATLAIVIALIAVAALVYLPLTRSLRIFYWVLLVLAGFGAFVINNMYLWAVAAVVFFGFALYETTRRLRSTGNSSLKSFVTHLAWLPVLALIVSGLLAWKGMQIATPVITRANAVYATAPSLSWRGTLDVGAGAVKSTPLFGVGPNRFSQAYLANKPGDVNVTDGWSLEFASAWSTLSTFIITEGLVGTVLWILLFVFFGIAGAHALKRLPEDPQSRFMTISSFGGAVLLWVMALVSVLPHTLLFLAFVLTGIFFASAVSSGSLTAYEMAPAEGSRLKKIAPSIAAFVVLVLVVWGLVYAKKTIALAYFGQGVKQLTVSGGDANKADADFATAQKWDASDIYLQARAEANIARASALVATLNAQSSASSSQAVLTQAASMLNDGLNYANQAVSFDSSNYYNYMSKARVGSAAVRLQIPNAYDTAVQSYTSAIQLNPGNPLIYLTLAQLQASANKLDDALQTTGAALRVKNNYLDAVFLLSQIEAAKGNLPDAITAAQFAAQLNNQSPIIFFQLGLLQYENKSYAAAADAFAAAIKVQPDYANAQYFLGLSDARLGKNAEAIAQFQALDASNPGNQEVQFILANLESGKSPFADAPAPVATAPEKRSSLPIKQK